MREQKTSRSCCRGILVGICGLILIMAGPADGNEPALILSNADCEKCHESETQEIAGLGMAHRSDVTCKSCHQGHRPKVQDNIPACNECHAGESHFEIDGCRSCHNPHAPMEITLEGDLKGVCLTCHETQGREMEANPSLHGEVSCTFCHAERHAAIPQCGECHDSHSDEMSQADCGTCHQAHRPTALSWGPETPSVHCSACHETASGQLSARETPHSKMECNFCHGGKHQFVPACSDCHGTPHAEGMHQKFPQCGDCHSTAHDLNNWSGKEENDR